MLPAQTHSSGDRCLAWGPRITGAAFAVLIAYVGRQEFGRGPEVPDRIIALVMHALQGTV